MERLVEIDKSDADALVDHAVAEGVKRGLLMAAEIVEDARNADIELCDMLAEQIRAKAAE